jgi:rhodanese-related sulfurtransferase
VAQILISNGLSNAKALLGGFAAWQQAGLPIEQAAP